MNSQAECRLIYQEAFGEEKEFEDLLFGNCFEYCKTIKASGRTVAMLFALPCLLKYDFKEIEVTYIFAAATSQKFRKKGYMRELINMVKAENKPIVLRPANAELIKFYKNLDFKPIRMAEGNVKPNLVPNGNFLSLANKINPPSENDEFIAMCYGNIDLKIVNFNYSMF